MEGSVLVCSHSPLVAPRMITHPQLVSKLPWLTTFAVVFLIVPNAEMDIMPKGYTPEKMDTSTKWAVTNFLEWMKSRQGAKDKSCCENIFQCIHPDVLCHWLSRFAAETRTRAGNYYLPSSICCLLVRVQQHMRSINPHALAFLDKGDKCFTALHNSLDVLFWGVLERHIGTSTPHH